jgi:acyl carrier protein
MNSDEIIACVRARFLASVPHLPASSLTDQADLFALKVLDSLSVVEFAVFLEKEFGVRVAASDLTRARLGTVSAIADLVESRIRRS